MKPKRYPEQVKWNQYGTNKKSKTSHGTFKDILADQGRTNREKGCQKMQRGVSNLNPNTENVIKNTIPKNIQKSVTEKQEE